MQLTDYQKELLLRLLDDKVSDSKKDANTVSELEEIIERTPTIEDFVRHLDMLQERCKDATFEERVQIYQEENAKAMKHDNVMLELDLNDIIKVGRYNYKEGHNAPQMLTYNGVTDVRVPKMPPTMPKEFGNIVINNCNVDSESLAENVRKELNKIGLKERINK